MKKLICIAAVVFSLIPSIGLSREPSCLSRATRAELTRMQGDLREGDLIFISSSSGQSDMLEEVTQSIWTHVGVVMKKDSLWGVYEASAKMKWTKLKDFVAKSKLQQFSIKRLDEEKCENLHMKCQVSANIEALRKNLKAMIDSPYDIRFQWDDKNLYCSEVTQKAYLRTFALKLGQDQKLGDMLRIPEGKTWESLPENSLARKAIVDRFNGGQDFDPNVTAVSPVSQYDSNLLKSVHECKAP